MDAQSGGSGDDKGTDIQRGARLIGDPVLLQTDQLLDGGQGVLLVQGRDAHTLTGGVDALDVLGGTEELDGAVGGAVGLQAFKDLLGVVEYHGGRLQSDGAVGNDAPVVPALAVGVVHQKHVVGKGSAEHQRGGVGLGLEDRCTLNGIFLHQDGLLAVSLLALSMAG